MRLLTTKQHYFAAVLTLTGQHEGSGSIEHGQESTLFQDSPYSLKLSRWRLMPGCMSVTEAQLRGEHKSTKMTVSLPLVLQVLSQIRTIRVQALLGSDMLLICISLAGTVRKTLACFRDSEVSGDLAQTYTPYTNSSLMLALSGDHTWTAEGDGTHAAGGCATKGNSSQHRHAYLHTVEHTTSATIALLQHRLSSILFLNFVQERNRDAYTLSQSGSPVPPLNPDNEVCLKEAASQQLGLLEEGLANILLPSRHEWEGAAQKLAHDKKVAMAWERHALQHFNGRLLPGCCHLGCSNLCGASEAALLTQLCSGCRRVRYCSVKCQREAWLVGGHKLVCSSMEHTPTGLEV